MISVSNKFGQKSALALWSITVKQYSSQSDQTGLLSPDLLEEIFSQVAKKYVFGEEVGDSGYQHYQCFISLKTKTRNIEKVLNEVIPEEFKDYFYACAAKDANALESYASKDGKVYRGPKSVSHKEDSSIILRPWQHKVTGYLDSLIKIRNSRKLLWISDVLGGQGKTMYLRYLSTKPDVDVCLLPRGSISSMYSCLTQIFLQVQNNDRPLIILIDLVRSDSLLQKEESTMELFQFIEVILNSWVSSASHGKFVEVKRKLGTTQVVVMTNVPVKRVHKYLSLDRFLSGEINIHGQIVMDAGQ